MANLQEEIFESEDFKEVDDVKTDSKPIELSNDNDVIEERIKPSKAFQIYAGQLFDPESSTQSSDKKNNAKTSRIYDTTQASDLNFESPLQTYKRLQYEMEEFKQKLEQIAQRAKKEQQDPTKQITQQLSKQLGNLWSNVESFKNDPQISSLFAEANSANLDTVDANYLFKRLQEFQAQVHKMDAGNGANANENRAVFTLYHDGTMNKQTFRMKEINDRVAKLEKIVGPKPESATIGDMTRSVEYLSSVLELLSDDMKLEQLVRRAHDLRKKLQEIQSKGHGAIELQITKTKEEKIKKMFEMMTRWDAAAMQLPTIVQRLRSVKNLHEESANVVQKVNRLETQNKLIQQSLESNKNILQNVQQSLAQNAATMSKNMESITERLNKIQATMKSLKM